MSESKTKVWTPLKKPPAPGSVHLMSDDAYLVISALREAHRKRLENEQKRYKQAKDIRSYYHDIYSDSFKTEQDENEDNRNNNDALGSEVPSPIPHFPASSQMGIPLQHEEVVGNTHIRRSDQSTTPSLPVIKEEVMEIEENFRQERLIPLVSQGGDTTTGAAYFTPCQAVPAPASVTNHDADSISMVAPVKEYDTTRITQRTLCVSSHNFTADALPSTSVISDEAGDQRISSAKSSFFKDHHTQNVHTQGINEIDSKSVTATISAKPNSLSGVLNADIHAQKTGIDIISNENSCNVASKLEYKTFLLATLVTSKSTEDVDVADTCTEQKTKVGDLPDTNSVEQRKHSAHTRPSIKEAGTADRLLSAGNRSSSSDVTLPDPIGNSKVTPTKRKIIPTFTKMMSGQKDKTKRRITEPSQMILEEVMGVGSRSAGLSPNAPWDDITKLSPSQLHLWQQKACEAEEIQMTLLYTDGSSQLREIEELTMRYRRTSCVHADGKASCILLAIQTKVDSGARYSLAKMPLNFRSQDSVDHVRPVLLALLESGVRKVCFDAQELMHAIVIHYKLMPQTGCNKWEILDPKVASWLLDPDQPPVTFSELMDRNLPGKYTRNSPDKRESSHEIHGADVVLLGPVMRDLSEMLEKKKLWPLYINIEIKLIPILAAMEVQGIRIDSEILKKYGGLLKESIKKAEAQCYEAAGHSFQINSHVQIRQVIFEELKLDEQCPGTKLARTNALNLKSTSETVLLKLKGVHPLPELILNYRQLVKLKSTYIDGIADYISGGYIHTSWDQTSAASGRLQSANPNVQNIPKNPVNLQDMDKKSPNHGGTSGATGSTLWMRAPFISHEGWSLLAADFHSIELRILAHLSQDSDLLSVFNDQRGLDIFIQLTCEWLGIKPEEVRTQDRERTKRIVYSVIYGVGPERLAETLNDSKENAKSFTKSFLAKFKGVKSFTNRCISECQRQGYVRTLFGRQRLVRDINSQNFHSRSHAERQAVNFVVQGSAADLCKLAMIHTIAELSHREKVRARLLVQIHDELLFEVHDEVVTEVRGILKNVMESPTKLCGQAVHLKVPLVVSVSVGKTWGHLKPF